MKQAYRAYEKWLENHCQSTECINQEHLQGLNVTHKQLFFINFAQVWCGAMRPEATKSKMKTAVHSPARYRVIGMYVSCTLIRIKMRFTIKNFVPMEFSLNQHAFISS